MCHSRIATEKGGGKGWGRTVVGRAVLKYIAPSEILEKAKTQFIKFFFSI